jgi:signal transduction histidine kinase
MTNIASACWHLVLGYDGTVLVAAGGAPASWVGGRLEDLEDAPDDLKQAAATLVGDARHAIAAVSVEVPLASMGTTTYVSVVDAMPLRRQLTPLKELLHSSLAGLAQQAAEADIRLTVDVDHRVPSHVLVDADRLGWAVATLARNALRHVRPGSLMMPSGSIAVRATFNSFGPEIIVEVQDDGPGIPAQQLSALFDPSSTHSNKALGLLMVREVVAAHGGNLEVDSQTDAFMSGSVVRITLPVPAAVDAGSIPVKK